MIHHLYIFLTISGFFSALSNCKIRLLFADGFFRADVTQIKRFDNRITKRSKERMWTDPDGAALMWQVRQTDNFKNLDIRIICKLPNERYLARTFNPVTSEPNGLSGSRYANVIFIILDRRCPNLVASQFEWKCEFTPFSPKLRFCFWVNCDKNYYVIRGPKEHEHGNMLSCKYFNNLTSTFQVRF